MDMLKALKQLRDDIKLWVTNNLNALNQKIDEKTIPIDNELDVSSTNPIQNKAVANEITSLNNRVGKTSVSAQIAAAVKNIPKFSGDYNDLTNAPNIAENESGDMTIVDEAGNIIFKADAEGIHTTAVSLNGEAAATEKYVDDAVANIPTPDVSGQINAHNASEEAHADIRQAIEDAKEELSESIVSESEDWKVIDEAGNIIFSVDATGAHTTELTLNGEAAATEKYVDDAIANIEIPEVDFTGYATETYVDNKVADLVNSAPEALDTLGELAIALENHEDAYDALLETVGNKATKQELEDAKAKLSESIESESEEWSIVDNQGNIIATVNSTGLETTTVRAKTVFVDDEEINASMNYNTETWIFTLKDGSTVTKSVVIA